MQPEVIRQAVEELLALYQSMSLIKWFNNNNMCDSINNFSKSGMTIRPFNFFNYSEHFPFLSFIKGLIVIFKVINQQSYLRSMKRASLLLLLVLLALTVADSNYTLALLPTDNGAMCLDGSPVGLYHLAGTGDNKNKYLLFFLGGGFCSGFTLAETIESCYQRSSTDRGSSKKLVESIDLSGVGLLSPLPQVNPVFHDWTKVVMQYCDGSEYSGTLDEPIAYKDAQLYFRGYNNTLEQLRFMDSHFDFYNGDTIVVTGISAGGIATYLYSNYLTEHTKTAKVYAMPDSGLFITEFYSEIVQKQVIKEQANSLFKLIHQDTDRGFPIKECFSEYPNDYYRCYNAANLAIYQKAPTLVIESTYDQWSIRNLLIAKCAAKEGKEAYSIKTCDDATRAVIEEYRKATVNAFYQMEAARKSLSLWAPSCVQHGFSASASFTSDDYRVPYQSGVTLAEAMQEFLDNPAGNKWHLDEVPWPLNYGCNGMADSASLPAEFNLLRE